MESQAKKWVGGEVGVCIGETDKEVGGWRGELVGCRG